MEQGDVLRVTDPMGEQVAGLFAFSAAGLDCSLSSGRTIDYASRIYLPSGGAVVEDSRPMFTILHDAVRRHDFLLENLVKAFKPFGIGPARISTTFNIFMRVNVSTRGAIAVKPPLSRPGDAIELRAEMDLICGLTACSAESPNNGMFKPIDWAIIQAPAAFD